MSYECHKYHWILQTKLGLKNETLIVRSVSSCFLKTTWPKHQISLSKSCSTVWKVCIFHKKILFLFLSYIIVFFICIIIMPYLVSVKKVKTSTKIRISFHFLFNKYLFTNNQQQSTNPTIYQFLLQHKRSIQNPSERLTTIMQDLFTYLRLRRHSISLLPSGTTFSLTLWQIEKPRDTSLGTAYRFPSHFVLRRATACYG